MPAHVNDFVGGIIKGGSLENSADTSGIIGHTFEHFASTFEDTACCSARR